MVEADEKYHIIAEIKNHGFGIYFSPSFLMTVSLGKTVVHFFDSEHHVGPSYFQYGQVTSLPGQVPSLYFSDIIDFD